MFGCVCIICSLGVYTSMAFVPYTLWVVYVSLLYCQLCIRVGMVVVVVSVHARRWSEADTWNARALNEHAIIHTYTRIYQYGYVHCTETARERERRKREGGDMLIRYQLWGRHSQLWIQYNIRRRRTHLINIITSSSLHYVRTTLLFVCLVGCSSITRNNNVLRLAVRLGCLVACVSSDLHIAKRP